MDLDLGRLVRDAGSEVLPLSQVGGYLLGARAIAFVGVPGTMAAASMRPSTPFTGGAVGFAPVLSSISSPGSAPRPKPGSRCGLPVRRSTSE